MRQLGTSTSSAGGAIQQEPSAAYLGLVLLVLLVRGAKACSSDQAHTSCPVEALITWVLLRGSYVDSLELELGSEAFPCNGVDGAPLPASGTAQLSPAFKRLFAPSRIEGQIPRLLQQVLQPP